MSKRIFPDEFLWGASTAAHQVEGDNHNQWSEWEKANAERLARGAKQRLGWLPNWKGVRAEAEDPANYISGRGVEHYKRYKEDFRLLKELRLNAFRFSIEWSRIEPEEGKWDELEIEHYRHYLRELKKQGIEPVVTFWHWTVPVWFAAKGGFVKRSNIRHFERYVAKIAAALGDDFTYVLLLNEPNNFALISYLLGTWPPQRHNFFLMLRVYCNLVAAHKGAYAILKNIRSGYLIGSAVHFADMRPFNSGNVLNRLLVAPRRYVWNWWFVDRIRRQLDFIGVNFYHTDYSNWYGKTVNPKQPVNDLGWYMEPSGLERVLTQLWRRYRLPIIVTENGVADTADVHRAWWLEQTIEAMRRAIAEGVDLRGYLHWSLLDNFEWAEGWWPKFGLVAVDRKTMERTIRPSARRLAEQIALLSAALKAKK